MSEPVMHESAGLNLFGVLLGDGDVVQEGDMYERLEGGWARARASIGMQLMAPVVQRWVRPGFEK